MINFIFTIKKTMRQGCGCNKNKEISSEEKKQIINQRIKKVKLSQIPLI